MNPLLRPALGLLLLMTLLTGVAYPLALTGIGHFLFPAQADGSLVRRGDTVVGSRLIAQGFADPRYFQPRPSAAGKGYDASSSSGSNLGVTNKANNDAIAARAAALESTSGPVPADLVTASGSGLDPDLTPMGAFFQVERVAAARKLPAATVRALVDSRIESRQWLVLGEPRVNVLELNLALDALK